MIFTVEFGKSSSSVFSFALTIAKKAPKFQIVGNSTQERYSATYDRLSDFMELAQQVRGWKSARLMIDGRQISLLEYLNLYQVNECYNKKQEFTNQRLYCFIGQDGSKLLFPCRFLHFYRRFSGGKYGKIHGDVLTLDKDHLKFVLEQQIRKTMCYCCPDMDMKHLLSSVDDWPNELPVTKDPFLANEIVVSFESLQSLQQETKILEDLLKDIDGLDNDKDSTEN
ncbi:MAG: hypothetical protein MUO97_00695 [Dehalococcoidia bacterium]|nr:hypothetical protein [Dehalococcoidia bacterium]